MTILQEILTQGIEKNVSDLHLNAQIGGHKIAYRCFGVLEEGPFLGESESKSLVSLIKLHARMDISQAMLPQDGRLDIVVDERQFDIRVSSLPTVMGEDFVMRFFEEKPITGDFLDLNFSPKACSIFQEMLTTRSGLVLVSGATGSGKTTTLYTALQSILNLGFCNIVTLEDPVERILPNVRQSQINTAAGYGFSQGFRAILRQDPDVIMVGEIRDAATAKTALEAASTGHLVLSSLHTPDCATSLLRLASFDLDPFWIQYALKGIVSQTLVRGCNGRVVITEMMQSSPQQRDIKVLDMASAKTYYSWEEDLKWKRGAGLIDELSVIARG